MEESNEREHVHSTCKPERTTANTMAIASHLALTAYKVVQSEMPLVCVTIRAYVQTAVEEPTVQSQTRMRPNADEDSATCLHEEGVRDGLGAA